MKNIDREAMPVLAEVSMEINQGDVIKSFKDIKVIDDLLGIVKAKTLINHSKGRKPKNEKRFDAIFRERLFLASNEAK